jgi:hypothetical protein
MKVSITFLAILFLFSCGNKTNTHSNGHSRVSIAATGNNPESESSGKFSETAGENTVFDGLIMTGNWILQEGGFPDQHLVFIRKESIASYSFF